MTIYEPPYGPEDLKDPPLEGSAFIQLLRDQKQSEYPDPPPFYQALYGGDLDRRGLQLWVKDMYSYWDHALVYSTGAIFIKTNHEGVRTHILRDRKSTRLNSSHSRASRMPSSA